MSAESAVEETISFEGPEKVLEVWFVPPQEWEDKDAAAAATAAGSQGPAGRNFLLSVPKATWAEMLELVHCQILSHIANDKADAYLLSESSMFVYEYQVVIKTCGTTTLLACLSKLLSIAASVGLAKVDDVFYNRQNFFFPEKQLAPHQGFTAECRILDSYFANGGAYVVGKVNENHYNFYNAESRMNRSDPAMQEKDSTLEILMTGLDHECMRNFYFEAGVSTQTVRERTGIAGFFPGALIDDWMFEPFGYSLNGLLPDGYFTIHITPQPNCSFVSFETNVPMSDYTPLIQRVLACFKPSRFILTHLANSLAAGSLTLNMGFDDAAVARTGVEEGGAGFRVVDNIFCHFEHYDLFFLQFQKNSKAAGADAKQAQAACEDNSTTPLPIKPLQQPATPAASAAAAGGNKRRLDEEGTILKPSSPFMAGARGGAVPGLELSADAAHVAKKARDLDYEL